MELYQIKQVIGIEYVGPYQIQTTASASVNFSTKLETNEICQDNSKTNLFLANDSAKILEKVRF